MSSGKGQGDRSKIDRVMSKWTYIANWVGGLGGGLLLLIAGIIAGSAIPSASAEQPYFLSMVLTALGWAGVAWAVLTLLRFVERVATTVPVSGRSARDTALLLLLPVFNIYWMVRVFVGFARRANTALHERGVEASLPVGLFAAFSELSVLAMIGAVITIFMPFDPTGRAIAAATFACAALSAIFAVYVMALATDAVVVLEAAETRVAATAAQ